MLREVTLEGQGGRILPAKLEMTVFGREVWTLMASRGITTQRELSRRILKTSGEAISYDAVRNYLYGRSSVPPGFPRLLCLALDLDEAEREKLAMAFAFGQEHTAPVDKQAS